MILHGAPAVVLQPHPDNYCAVPYPKNRKIEAKKNLDQIRLICRFSSNFLTAVLSSLRRFNLPVGRLEVIVRIQY